VALGLALRGVASSAMDLSDGLVGDLGHILAASAVGAELDADALTAQGRDANAPTHIGLEHVLTGGDDYELLFTASARLRGDVLAIGHRSAVPLTRVGSVQPAPGLWLKDATGRRPVDAFRSFDHFA
jgi:thiamine-monophosphate kinase